MSEDICNTCHGHGEYVYSTTSMGKGPGGAAMTVGPCPGTKHQPDNTDCPVVLAMIEMYGKWFPRDELEEPE